MSAVPIVLLSSFALLVSFYALHRVTDHYFVDSLEIISKRLRMTSDIAGATLMAMGSSAPELFTSMLALIKGMEYASLGAGTIVGSAIFNVLVIIGASVYLHQSLLTWQPVVRDLSFYILSILLLYWVFQDGVITFNESVYFIVLYLIYLVALPVWRRILPYEDQADSVPNIVREEEISFEKKHHKLLLILKPVDMICDLLIPSVAKHPRLYVVTFASSILMIAALSWVLVEAGVIIATTLGIPDAIIGLTILAVGTSVPDLIASMVVARRGKGDMAVSNAIGSNIFDILIGLGAVWMIMIYVNGESIIISIDNLGGSVMLLIATVASLLFLLLVNRWTIGRKSGMVLIGLYCAYIVSIVMGWL